MKQNDPQYTVAVGALPARRDVRVGKPSRLITSAMRAKVAFPAAGGFTQGMGGNFYSPELSPDFLELPQSTDEQRNYYRFFYENDPFVGQAIDLQTDLPLSKLRLRKPQAKNKQLADAATRFCTRWADDIELLQRLMEIVHDLTLCGEVTVFMEDASPDPPKEVTHKVVYEMAADGSLTPKDVPLEDGDQRMVEWLKKNYHGWSAITVLPPEQVHIETFTFSKVKLLELVPDSKTKAIIERATQGDLRALEVVHSMPEEIVQCVLRGENIPLNTNPAAGSFAYHMARKKSQYEERGKSILQRCLRTLVYRDKLRQAQTSIASRHMTPYRLIYAEDMNAEQTEALREQVDLALQDPDYSIITNFQVNWEEKGAGTDNRLLDLSNEYDLTDRQMYAGLGVTESLLSGESSYSGDRIHLEVINIRFMLLREMLQNFVDKYIFAPMCARMGFIEEDEDGREVIIHPRLSFTRLALRDNQETFDALFNLYQKGSLDIDTILDLLNIDPETVREKLERDMMTLNDATFNEVFRGIYSAVGQMLAENSNVAEKIADQLGLDYAKANPNARFASLAKKAKQQENPIDFILDNVLKMARKHLQTEIPKLVEQYKAP